MPEIGIIIQKYEKKGKKHPFLGCKWLFFGIFDHFGVYGAILQQSQDILNQFPQIIQSLQAESRQIPFFIFDEAQNLSQHVLEELRLITNHDQSTLPAMVLVAHGAFRDRLKLACFHSLRYRLNLVASIEPLSKSELNDYIHFHLKLSGSTNSIFLEESITSIFNASKGLPRLINRICLEALYSAAQKNLSSIDQSIIESVLIDLI